eukprot:8152388-Pyramimonas_sp.AAC.1
MQRAKNQSEEKGSFAGPTTGACVAGPGCGSDGGNWPQAVSGQRHTSTSPAASTPSVTFPVRHLRSCLPLRQLLAVLDGQQCRLYYRESTSSCL